MYWVMQRKERILVLSGHDYKQQQHNNSNQTISRLGPQATRRYFSQNTEHHVVTFVRAIVAAAWDAFDGMMMMMLIHGTMIKMTTHITTHRNNSMAFCW
jgi:hypothetical protein